MPTLWLPWPGKTNAMRLLTRHSGSDKQSARYATYRLFDGARRLDRQHLATAIGATIRAGVMREPRLAALRADLELRQLDAMMLAAVTLPVIGDLLFW